MMKIKIQPKMKEVYALNDLSQDSQEVGMPHEPKRYSGNGMENESCGCGTCEACGSKNKVLKIKINERIGPPPAPQQAARTSQVAQAPQIAKSQLTPQQSPPQGANTPQNQKNQIKTYGELKSIVNKIIMKKRAQAGAGVGLGVGVDFAISAVQSVVPGLAIAKTTYDFFKSIYTATDDKKTNTWLDKLNVDDQYSKIVDDSVENAFLKELTNMIMSKPDNEPIPADFNINVELQKYLKKKYSNRSVAMVSENKIVVKILKNETADKLHGGSADYMPRKDFNKKELSMGIEDEKEHTDDDKIASEIARDHLANDPHYYTHAKEAGLEEKKDRCYNLAKQKYDVFPSAYASGFIVRCRKGQVAKKKNEEVDEGTFDKEKSKGLHGWFQRQGGKGKSKGWVDCNTCKNDAETGRKTCKSCGRQDGEKRSKYPACRPTPSACNKRGTSKKKSSNPVSWKDKKDEN